MKVLPVGTFVKPVTLSSGAQRDCVTLINPTPSKGAAIFIAIARGALRRNLPTKFMAVASRGNLASALKAMGLDLAEMPNVFSVPMQEDMSDVWSRTKILLCPSLGYESGSRTIVEACSAGIPVLATDCGGSSELLGKAGFIFPVPTELKGNFLGPVSKDVVGPWLDTIERLVVDKEYFTQASERASNRYKALNDPDPIINLENVLQNLVNEAREAPLLRKETRPP